MLAIDAPTIIRNAAGQRPGERLLNAGFRKYGLGVSSGESWTAFCGEDNRVLAGLRDLWLPARSRDNTANARPVYRLGYNKGSVAERAVQLKRLRQYLYSLKDCEQPCVLAKLPAVPAGGIARRHVEDRLDAILCAYTGATGSWGSTRNRVFGGCGIRISHHTSH
jgi:predicted RNase H-like nuclease